MQNNVSVVGQGHDYTKEDKLRDELERKELIAKRDREIREEYAKRAEEAKKRHKKELPKAILKKTGMIIAKIGGILVCVNVGYFALFRGSAFLNTVGTDLLKFDEREYHKNDRVEAGYYNEHPVTVVVSNQFNANYQDVIIDAIETFDEKATGIKFNISVGETTGSKCDIRVHSGSAKNEGDSVVAYASLGDLDDNRIQGYIVIDTERVSGINMLIKATVMHELGHVIGLAHSKNPNDLMFPSISRLSLSRKDISRINTIYPEADDKQKTLQYYVSPSQDLSTTYEEEREQF